MPTIKRPLTITLLLLSHAALGQSWYEPYLQTFREGDRSFMFEWENDYFTASDRYYTNGMRLTWNRSSRNFYQEGDGEAVRVDGADARRPSTFRYVSGAHLVQTFYTPRDLTLLPDQIPPEDRPYAGILNLGAYWGRDYYDDRRWRMTLDLGCFGPCAGAGPTQREFHKWIGDDRPMGWDQQIRDEPFAQLTYSRHLAIPGFLKSEAADASGPDATRRWDLQPYYRLELGNLWTRAHAGATFRLGLHDMQSYFLGAGIEDTVPEKLRQTELFALSSAPEPARCWLRYLCLPQEAFAFARLEGSLVAHNSTIEGGLFNDDSPHTNEAEDALTTAALGVVLRWENLRLAFTRSFRSPEQANQPHSFTYHKWGELQLTWSKSLTP